MAVNRAVEDLATTAGHRVPWKSETWSMPPAPLPCSALEPPCLPLSKRRRSRVNFWDKLNKFCSIDELDLESEFFTKAIV
jgi:hypothetical protein